MNEPLDLDALEAVARAATEGTWVDADPPNLTTYTQLDGWNHPKERAEAIAQYHADCHHMATFDPPTVLALIAKLREAEAEAARYESAIRQALAFESVLPAIATEPRRILTAALGYKPTNQEGEQNDG